MYDRYDRHKCIIPPKFWSGFFVQHTKRKNLNCDPRGDVNVGPFYQPEVAVTVPLQGEGIWKGGL